MNAIVYYGVRLNADWLINLINLDSLNFFGVISLFYLHNTFLVLFFYYIFIIY